MIEHRDGGCAVPGCGRTRGLEIHHLWHWEDGGPTETHNLLTLCKRHHHLHHQHFLAFTGNPNLPAGTPGSLEVLDHHGHTLDPTGRPVPLHATPNATGGTDRPGDNTPTDTDPPPADSPPQTTTNHAQPDDAETPAPDPAPNPNPEPEPADLCDHARARGIPTPTYTSPLNERIDTWGFHLNPRPPAPTRPNQWTERLTKLPPAPATPRSTSRQPVDPPRRT